MDLIKERFAALSDAILAIAMTILIIEIKAPTSSSHLIELFADMGFFVVSFIFIANFWYEQTLTNIATKTTNNEIVSLQLINHLLICFVPLFTRLMMVNENKQLCVLIYGILTLAINLITEITRLRMVHYDLVKELTVPKKKLEYRIVSLSRNLLFVQVLIIILATLIPTIGMYFYVIFPIAMFIRRYRTGRYYASHGLKAPSIFMLYFRRKRQEK